jgi:hypothetical protein
MKAPSLRRTSLVFLAAPFLCVVAATAWADPVKLAGSVVSLAGDNLVVADQSGAPQSVHLTGASRITVRAPVDASHVTANTFVGVAAVTRPDGTLQATLVQIFPEALRGQGEGHRPMTGAGTTMTNATVKSVAAASANSMTNATVASVATAPGELKLNVEYKGGSQVILVPNGTPIIMIEPADRSVLAAGAHVLVYAERDSGGGLEVQRVSVGKNGSTPLS